MQHVPACVPSPITADIADITAAAAGEARAEHMNVISACEGRAAGAEVVWAWVKSTRAAERETMEENMWE